MEKRSFVDCIIFANLRNTKGCIPLIIYEENRICWILKGEALDPTLSGTRFGRGKTD
jgi:hypothetical protein